MTMAVRVQLTGRVQGCGVRPAIVRLALHCQVVGWVENASDQVRLHVQGLPDQVAHFINGLSTSLPSPARLEHLHRQEVALDPTLEGFVIRPSFHAHDGLTLPDIPADRAICEACLQELRNPHSRRYRWPFIACSACGPRYAWLKALPFARHNTTFSAWLPCATCQHEYAAPEDRRFGMELIACADCGPQFHYLDAHVSLHGDACIRAMVECLRAGGVLALQGFTGFQLLALARDAVAVAKVRQFKARKTRPLALLAGSIDDVERMASVSAAEAAWLTGPHRPIVLLPRRERALWPWIALDNPRWGIMLPAHGMQALLLDALRSRQEGGSAFPEVLVATSANLRGEPIAAEFNTLMPWLGRGIDAIGHHPIPVWQPQDDSVLALLDGAPVFLRRARGFAHDILLDHSGGDSGQPSHVQGEGAFLKTTLALRTGDRMLVSQYVGDMHSVAVAERKRQVSERLTALCSFRPAVVVHDAHPDHPDAGLASAAEARSPVHQAMFHHRAHVAALVAEQGDFSPALVAAWDGIGYGEQGQWWGSEVFTLNGTTLSPRFGLQPFALPGGDRAAHEPWRVMVALLVQAGIAPAAVHAFLQQAATHQISKSEGGATDEAQRASVARLVIDAVQKDQYLPRCTSMGRFVEGLAALLLRAFDNDHEGHAACRLEYAAATVSEAAGGQIAPFALSTVTDSHGIQRWAWQPFVAQLWSYVQNGSCAQSGFSGQNAPTPALLARFVLDTLAESLITACLQSGHKTLGLSGGCFQNLYWLMYLRKRCDQEGIRLIRPLRFPPNDGAIALGQVMGWAFPTP